MLETACALVVNSAAASVAAVVVFVAPADARTPALLVAVFAAVAVARTAFAAVPPACFFETMLVSPVFAAALSLCILLAFVSSCFSVPRSLHSLTFREQACGSSIQMPSKIPSITKVVIALNELDFIASSKTQLVGTSGCKVVCNGAY